MYGAVLDVKVGIGGARGFTDDRDGVRGAAITEVWE